MNENERELLEQLKRQREANAEQQLRRIEQQVDVGDCALSEWAGQYTNMLLSAKIELLERDRMHEFTVLQTAEGEKVNAKLINGKYGLCWALLDEKGEFTGEFVNHAYTDRQKANLLKKGYRIGTEMRKAWCKLAGQGYTLTVLYFEAEELYGMEETEK